MGEGKVKEIIISALQQGATMLIFDQELSPVQVRSISAITEIKVIDRSQLILDIFARRAHTLDGKVQVELAQLKYLMPRLIGRVITSYSIHYTKLYEPDAFGFILFPFYTKHN